MGTYWIEWMTDGSLSSGPWAPPITILDQTTTGNALQYTTAWAPALDSGTSTQQGMPFIIEGMLLGGDVPWVWEVPTHTVVPAEGAENVGLYFTALYTDATPMPPGTYTATMILIHNAGRPVEIPVTMHIIEQVVTPTAAFAATTPVCLGEEMWFYFTGDPGSPAADAYTWDFGDGISMTVGTPDPVMHLYALPGSYDVTLEVCITAWGVCDSAAGQVQVLALPEAAFTYTANLLTVAFTDQSQNATAWAWDFGDGATSTETNPIHTYPDEGTYTVVLTVTGTCGSDTVSMDITVTRFYYIYIPLITKGYTQP